MITEDKVKERLESPNNLANRFSITPPVKVVEKRGVGMPHGKKILPTFIKNTMVIMDRGGVKQREIGKEFDVSQGAVSSIATGKTHYDHEQVGRKLGVMRDLALEKLMDTMGLISEDKLIKVDAVGLSKIAQNLANVVKVTLPKEDKMGNGGSIQLTVYAPQLAMERDYEVIDV